MASRGTRVRPRRLHAYNAFTGLYVSSTHGGTISDSINVLFCDFDLDVENPQHASDLTNYLDGIRRLLMDVLNEDEVWIVYHSVTRVTGG